MASIACSIFLRTLSSSSSSPTSHASKVGTPFLAHRKSLRWLGAPPMRGVTVVGHGGGGGARCWFRFGKDAERAGVYGSQSRDDFDRDDVEQYFNYMGMLAVEGSYDKMEALLNQNIHPVDILLMLAASEGDKPKIEELLRAGAKYDVKDVDGRTALDRAVSDEIRELILGFSVQSA